MASSPGAVEVLPMNSWSPILLAVMQEVLQIFLPFVRR